MKRNKSLNSETLNLSKEGYIEIENISEIFNTTFSKREVSTSSTRIFFLLHILLSL